MLGPFRKKLKDAEDSQDTNGVQGRVWGPGGGKGGAVKTTNPLPVLPMELFKDDNSIVVMFPFKVLMLKIYTKAFTSK